MNWVYISGIELKNYNAPLGGRSFSMRFLKNESSSFCVSRVVSICVCLLCICHCMRRTKPKIIREMVIKSPNIHWSISNLLFISSNRALVDSFRSSIRLFVSAICCWSAFIPSSTRVNLSTISLSLILGATSTAKTDEVTIRRLNNTDDNANPHLFFMIVL